MIQRRIQIHQQGGSRPVSWPKVIELFLLTKETRLAPRTLLDYRYHLDRFFKTIKVPLDEYSELRLAVLKYFAESKTAAPATFNTRRKYLAAFFAWALEEGYIADNPMRAISKQPEENKPRAVSFDVARQLLALPDRKTFSGLRDYALIVLTADTGIRPSEAFGLKMEDFNPKARQIVIPQSVAKTRRSRFVPLRPVTVEAIERLILTRHPGWEDEVPIFCNQDGQPLNRYSWARRMRMYSGKVGAKVTPYMLRHTFATLFLRGGGDLFTLQQIMGHSNLAMTRRYVALTDGDLYVKHEQASPLNTLLPQKQRARRKLL